VSAPDRFSAVNRTIDLLCAADSVTLERRTQVAFSIPIFPGGIGALLRADAPFRLREVLSGHAQTFRPTWRANATQLLTAKAFAAVTGTTAETWLARRIDELQVVTRVVPAAGYAAGIDAVLSRNADALFGERAVLLDTVRHRTDTDLIVLDRLFTYEPLALAMKADDEAFRLLVDRALTKFYASGQLAALYTTFFGEPDQSAINFFRWSTPTE
jgi:ABC-type amino acid transport substrate-binding protein